MGRVSAMASDHVKRWEAVLMSLPRRRTKELADRRMSARIALAAAEWRELVGAESALRVFSLEDMFTILDAILAGNGDPNKGKRNE